MSERLDRIGRQLEAIEEALETARAEPDPERRNRWLEVVGRATDAVRAEYTAAIEEEKRRPALRIVKGGAVIAAMTALADWLRNNLRTHPHAGAVALVAATTAALTVALVYQGLHHNTGTPPLSSGPSVSASQPASPGPSVSPTPSPTSSSPHPPPPAGETTSPPPKTSTPPSGASVPPPMMVDAPGTTGAPTSSVKLSPSPPQPTGTPVASPPTVGPTTGTASPSAPSRPAGRCVNLDLRPALGANLCP